MNTIIFLILRRMRAPLLVLICTYAVAVLGLVLIPGVDAEGKPWHMDFFHAFYFISFMASTIGLGEIPYPFSEGQRLWVTFTIYSTVVAWIYSIGTLLTLVQDQAFRRAVTERRFARTVRSLRESFYLVCGYGDTGSALVKALTERDQRAVVVEICEERVNILDMQNLRQYVPVLHGDAGRPVQLLAAGLEHPKCAGVVAVTNINEVNLKVAIAAKLLHKGITVICRADSHDVEANMASFGTDYIIDPFDTFAAHLAVALRTPGIYLLHEWLTGKRQVESGGFLQPPWNGPWVVCGYGRFGKAVCKRLQAEGIKTIVIEARPEQTGMPQEGCVVGRGTEAVTLQEALIEQAVGLVAGTDDDTNNLSIIMTARELNPDLFVVARQNQRDNQSIVDAVAADMVMHSSSIIANKIRVLLATPRLYDFIRLAGDQDDGWANELISRIAGLVDVALPDVWEVGLSEKGAPAVWAALGRGQQVALRQLQPDPDMSLVEGDCVLFCGRSGAHNRMEWTLQNENALDYILTRETRPQGLIWRMFQGKRRAGPDVVGLE